MTASKKKTVRTQRGVEPAGRPARREVERGRRARTNSSMSQRGNRSPRTPRTADGSKDTGAALHVELGNGENVSHDADGPFACEKG